MSASYTVQAFIDHYNSPEEMNAPEKRVILNLVTKFRLNLTSMRQLSSIRPKTLKSGRLDQYGNEMVRLVGENSVIQAFTIQAKIESYPNLEIHYAIKVALLNQLYQLIVNDPNIQCFDVVEKPDHRHMNKTKSNLPSNIYGICYTDWSVGLCV